MNDFKGCARKMVVNLQSGKDAEATKVWQKLVLVSKRGFDEIYTRLNVSFDSKLEGTGYCGESFYQSRIPAVVSELESKGLTKKENGAVVLYTGLPQAKTEDGEMPLFLSKSEGGFGYDSTDMAAAKFRLEQLKCNRVLYVTDAGQEVHFAMVFDAAAKAGWISPNARLEHVKFGVVKRKDGQKFKTREGETITLLSLLEDARLVVGAVEDGEVAPLCSLAGLTLDVHSHLNGLVAILQHTHEADFIA